MINKLTTFGEFEIDPFGAQETFNSVTKPYETPKIGKTLNDRHLTVEQKIRRYEEEIKHVGDSKMLHNLCANP